MSGLVLSLFPGIGMLDRAFEEVGFCVVRGPDVLWGGDVRSFHPPAGKFDGVIGGPPCQSFSSLANLVYAKGLEPKFGNLIPDFARCIIEAQPRWFLMECVPKAPDPEPEGYGVASFLLDNCWLGEAQRRKRKFWFGLRGEEAPNLRKWIPGTALELVETATSVVKDEVRAWDGGGVKRSAVTQSHVNNDPVRKGRAKTQAVAADARAVPVRHGGSGKVKTSAVTGRHDGAVGSPAKSYEPERRTLPDMLELQGFPPDWLEHQPWTMQAKRQMVGNGVPLPMGRAIAEAVVKALQA